MAKRAGLEPRRRHKAAGAAVLKILRKLIWAGAQEVTRREGGRTEREGARGAGRRQSLPGSGERRVAAAAGDGMRTPSCGARR